MEPIPVDLGKTYTVVPSVYDRHVYGEIKHYKVGCWVKYKDNSLVRTIRVVKEVQGQFWVEIEEMSDGLVKVSLRLVNSKGEVLKAYYREGKGSFVRQEIEKISVEVPIQDPLEVDTKTIDYKIKDKFEKATLVKRTFEDEVGRRFCVTTHWSKVVPQLYESSEFGGLVKKVTNDATIELVEFGFDKNFTFAFPSD